jgi:hypothetical protein
MLTEISGRSVSYLTFLITSLSFRRKPESIASTKHGFRPSPTAVRRKFLHVLPEWLNVRHPSESWDPATYRASKALDPSFRWDDESVALNFLKKFVGITLRVALFLRASFSPGSNGRSPDTMWLF